jgi:hypothetical protein
MKKRKFKKGPQVVSVAEIPEHDWFIVKAGTWDRTMHREVLRSWTIRTCEQFIDHGMIFIAQRLTNGEFYEGMSDEQIRGMLEDRMCDYCPLPDELKGAHCYGDAPVMCEGTHCAEAIAAWKEEFVE